MGLISLLLALYSKIWAAHPVVLEITKIGVNKPVGIPHYFNTKYLMISRSRIKIKVG